MKHILPAFLILPLIACSSDSAGRTAASFAAEERFADASAEHEDAFAEKVLYAVPVSGTAETNGAFKARYKFTNGREGRIVGDIKAEFDFAENTMSGEVSDIETRMFKQGSEAERLESGGILTLSGARDLSTTPSGHAFEGTLTGNIVMPNPDGTDSNVSNDFTLNTDGLILRDEETPKLPDGTYERTIIGARGSVDANLENMDETNQTLPADVSEITGQWSGTVSP